MVNAFSDIASEAANAYVEGAAEFAGEKMAESTLQGMHNPKALLNKNVYQRQADLKEWSDLSADEIKEKIILLSSAESSKTGIDSGRYIFLNKVLTEKAIKEDDLVNIAEEIYQAKGFTKMPLPLFTNLKKIFKPKKYFSYYSPLDRIVQGLYFLSEKIGLNSWIDKKYQS
ncbi:MAG: hypothetical protein MK033_10610 [Candidatus Caenarcaniphilales bacterium]|nr:hypothetical protein [Candidatus Caenarcaniphilales bacterium]